MPADPDGDNIFITFFIISVVFFISGILYSVSDAALRHGSIDKNDDEKLDAKKERISKIADDNDTMLSPLRLGISFNALLFSLFNAAAFCNLFKGAFNFISDGVLRSNCSFILAGFAFWLFYLLFALFLPKKLCA